MHARWQRLKNYAAQLTVVCNTICAKWLHMAQRLTDPRSPDHFQNGQTATDGLYQGPTAISKDAINIVRRIKLLGFNAVRLPFSMRDLINATAADFHWGVNNCLNIAQNDIIQSVTNPAAAPIPSTSSHFPTHTLPHLHFSRMVGVFPPRGG